MLEVRGLHCRYGKVGVLKGISLGVREANRAYVGARVRHA
jgi:ABC-type histidine transport system ATPase subunit